MKIKAVLNKHYEFFHKNGLSKNLGDSYLLTHNKIFNLIRSKTLSLGYQFSDAIDSDYITLSMGQLESILKRKTIPYLNNVDPLKKLLDNNLNTLDWEHIVDNLRANYIFHESCHAIARHFSFKANSTNLFVTIMLLEESFANTCEFLLIADAHEQIHRTFLEKNSYFTVFNDRTNLKKAIDQYGIEPVFKFMILGYLHSNFLNEKLTDSDFKKIVSLSGFKNSVESHVLKNLVQNVFALNPRFRYVTTEMYLRLNKINDPLDKVLNFDSLKLISEDQNLNLYFNNLSSFVKNYND